MNALQMSPQNPHVRTCGVSLEGTRLGRRVGRGMQLGAAFTTLFTDTNLFIEWVSESVGDALGFEPHELVGVNGMDLIHPEDLADNMNLIADQLAAPVSYGDGADPARRSLNTLRMRHKDGSYTAVEIAVTNLSTDPEVAGFFIYARPADDRRHMEEAYRRLASGATVDDVIDSTVSLLKSQFVGASVSITMNVNADDGVNEELAKDPWSFIVRDPWDAPLGLIRVRPPGDQPTPSEWVRHVIARSEDILRLLSQRENLLRQLRRAAITDALTGALNRRGLLEVFDEMAARTTPSPTALLYVDLDDFKRINDTFGHLRADEVLRAVVGRLNGSIRDGDVVARLGGDEFAVVCRRVFPHDGVDIVVQRILERFREPVIVEDSIIPVSMSIGVAVTRQGNYDRLLGSADRALLQAKAAGKACSISVSAD
jgi:diguanylate cyclase (GGDEF)-like protein/PAS domain S-box-containing protein